MNKKIKKKLVKQINRTLASKASQFLDGNDKFQEVFVYRVHQFTGESIHSIKQRLNLYID